MTGFDPVSFRASRESACDGRRALAETNGYPNERGSGSLEAIRPIVAIFSRILVPVDGSDESNAAVTVGTSLARDLAANELCFCYVVNSDKEYRIAAALDAGPTSDELIAETAREGNEHVEAAQRLARAAGVSSTTAVLEGNPPVAIAAFARERAFDVIVAGTHGHDGFARLFFGSTAEQIMRHAGVPVLMVKR